MLSVARGGGGAFSELAETTSESVPGVSLSQSGDAPRFSRQRAPRALSSPAARWVPVALARRARLAKSVA